MRCLSIIASTALLSSAWAFDIHPHQVGDSLNTSQARVLLKKYAERPRQPWREPDPARIPTGPEGEQIRWGIALMTDTSQRIGNLAPDPAKRLNWNSLNCIHCHQAGASGLPGTKHFAMPLVNAVNDYPRFDPKSGKIISLEQRAMGMFGAAPVRIKAEMPEFQAIMAYLRWLSQDSVPGHAMEGTGLMPLPTVARAADPARGQKLYAAQCAACHGADATGQRKPDFAQGGGYVFPPLAGSDTYDNAGHMFAVPLMARYIRASMPKGSSYDKPLLTPEQALDIAAYINDDPMPRNQHPNRKALYPDAALRPQGFAIPENFNHPKRYLRAKFGPFNHINEDY